jgi:hypothetical protein
MAAGTGVITLVSIIKPRFLRLFSQVAFDSIISLVKRAEPGTPFTISKTTSATAILTAVSNSLITLDIAVFKLCELIEVESDEAVAAGLVRRLECLKTASDIKAKTTGPGNFSGLMDTGILTFMLAKVSGFVMNKEMEIKLQGNKKSSDSSSDLTAKLVRPANMVECSEMFNLFILYVHALAISNVLVITDFFEHAFYDTIRRRKESWQFAFELVVVMFRRIEDSGGRLNLGNAYEETYLNTVMDEARTNLVFFRPPGGNPGIVNDTTGAPVKFNGRYNAQGRTCVAFNFAREHSAGALKPDGTCKYNHVCDHYVTGKGKAGRCLGSKGTPGHCRAHCDNPDKCDNPAPN